MLLPLIPPLIEAIRTSPITDGATAKLPIRPLNFEDLFFGAMHDKGDESRSELWNLSKLPHDKNTLQTSVGEIRGASDTSYPIMIDLNASDPVLIEAFNDWLRNTRKEQQSKKSNRERPAYMDWARYGLLPYLDLFIWTKETGNQISHHLMAEAVGYRKGGDSFRKTVPKLANDLMHNLSGLEALAALEGKAEKPKP